MTDKVVGFSSEEDSVVVITPVDGGERIKCEFFTYDGEPIGLVQYNPVYTTVWYEDARQHIERMGGVEVLTDRIFLEHLPGSFVKFADLKETFWGSDEELVTFLNGMMSFGTNPHPWMGTDDMDPAYRDQPVVWDGCFELTEAKEVIFTGSTAPCGDGERTFRLVNDYDLIYFC